MRRLQAPSAKLFDAMLGDPVADHYGYALMKSTGLKSGSLYPILRRLEDRSWVERRNEPSPVDGRPPRKVYRLTGEGERAMRPLLAEYEARHGALAWV